MMHNNDLDSDLMKMQEVHLFYYLYLFELYVCILNIVYVHRLK